MDRIPVEIFCTIFQLASLQVPGNDSIRTNAEVSEGRRWPGVFDLDRGPWAISRVCSRWRTICMSAPEIWSRFILSADGSPSGRVAADVLKTWLSLSGTSTLSFLIKTDGICNSSEFMALFRILMKHSDRWEKIEVINGTFAFWLMLDRNNVKERLNALKSITFLSEGAQREYVTDPTSETSFISTCYHVFDKAPRFHILINHDYFPISHTNMPWSQFTEYDGSDRVNFSEHIRILHRTPNLENCRLEIAISGYDGLDAYGKPQPLSITLNNLTILRIHLTRSVIPESEIASNISGLMRNLVLPSLKTLSLKSSLETVSVPFTEFATVLLSSQCELLELELSSMVVAHSDDIVQLLRASPSLQRLRLTIDSSRGSRMIQDTVFPRLIVNESPENTLVPLLRSLTLVMPMRLAVINLDLPCLSAGIRSRWVSPPKPGYFIRDLFVLLGGEEDDGLEKDDEIPDKMPPMVEVLQEEGLNVVVQKLGTSEFLS